jgi:hypothetical protein
MRGSKIEGGRDMELRGKCGENERESRGKVMDKVKIVKRINDKKLLRE